MKLILALLLTATTAHAGMMKISGGDVLASGAVPFTGNITLNAQSDLRLADADSSHYVAHQAPTTVTSNVTLTWPDTDGDADQVLKTNGSGVLAWTTPSAGSGDIEGVTAGTGISGGGTSGTVTVNALMHTNGIVNCSVDATVSGDALTVHLKGADGNALGATNACIVTFRSATVTSGTQSQVSATSATTVVVPDTATLGCTVSVACPLYVYAFNDGGTLKVGVTSWKILDEGAVASTTAVGTGSDTLGTIYATDAISSKAARLMGEVLITLAASEHWSNAATTIKNVPFQHYGWSLASFTPTITHNSGSMTNATNTGLWQRVRDKVYVRGHTTFSGAGGTFSRFYSSLPTGCVIDTTKHLDNSGGGTSYNAYGFVLIFDASGADFTGFVRYGEVTDKVLLNVQKADGTYVQTADYTGTVPITWASGDDINYYYDVYCVGW